MATGNRTFTRPSPMSRLPLRTQELIYQLYLKWRREMATMATTPMLRREPFVYAQDMSEEEARGVFQEKQAKNYDKQFAKLAPIKDGLHLLTRIVLAELPDDAHILCVGAGTGSELLYLANAFPKWKFTAVDPSTPMLNICRTQATKMGFADRCSFHEGYLDTLPRSEPFDGAISFLVSHFIMDPDERRQFFRCISDRLTHGGLLVSCDMASDMSAPGFESLLEQWLRTLRYSGMPEERVSGFRESFGVDVALLPPKEVEAIIASAGFSQPELYWQSLLMHGWYAVKAS